MRFYLAAFRIRPPPIPPYQLPLTYLKRQPAPQRQRAPEGQFQHLPERAVADGLRSEFADEGQARHGLGKQIDRHKGKERKDRACKDEDDQGRPAVHVQKCHGAE